MKKYKKLSKKYYNIIILLLILLVLFSMSKLISDKRSLSVTDNENYQKEILRLDRDKKIDNIDNNIFIRIVQHTFPNKKVQKQYKPILSFNEFKSSFYARIFRIDFSNPLTFIQAQFPVVAAHHDVLVANISNSEGKETEKDWSKEIYFVDYDGEEKAVTADNINDEYNINKNEPIDGDDLGEIKDGIYVIGDGDIVDSLNPVSTTDLAGTPKPKPIKIEKDKPSILIYHTHGTESYKPATEGNYHSLKKEYTVIEVANVISQELEKKGYNIVHDDTYHDYPSYNGSYGRSVVTAKSILEKNPSIKIILDIHRDGYDKMDTRKDRLKLIENSRTKINGEYAARFQFVVGAKSKNRKEVETFANFVKAVSDSKYPGFSKEILVKQYGSYNQYLSDYAALIELGSNANTIEEAKKAGYYLADVIADTLNLLSE